MKALILAGGAGTRLRPITHTRAKQLVPVANTPILFYGIESMVAAGIKEIGVITGDTGPEVREALGDGSRFGATITYIPQDAPLGLAHCVLIARDFLGDDDFVMYLGDNLLEQDLAAFVAAFEAARAGADPPAAQILLKQVPDPHRFGIASLDAAGHVVGARREAGGSAVGPRPRRRLPVRPDDPRGRAGDRPVGPRRARDHRRHPVADHVGAPGAHRAAHRLVDRHRQADAAAGGEPAAAREGRDRASTAPSTRRPTLDGRVVVEAGAEIVNSTLRGPLAIGAGTRVVDSFIGPFTAIGAGCEILNSEIEHSVVMDDSSVHDIPRLEDSLIGREAVIRRSQVRPRALRLMVGDHCQIDVE